MDAASAELISICLSLFERGLSPGTTGNVSVRTNAGILITPTGRCMGRLHTDDLATVDMAGRVADGPQPSREVGLHLAAHRLKPANRAVVHLHSPYATAVSCLADLDPDQALGALTGYHAMKVGRLGLVPYHPPGSPQLVVALEKHLYRADAVLLANHGLLVGGTDLENAADAAEQIEQSSRIYFLVAGRPVSPVPQLEVTG